MSTRTLTDRERSVLDTMLSVDSDRVKAFRDQARTAMVDLSLSCTCGCPSISFVNPSSDRRLEILMEASTVDRSVALFLYAQDDRLGGIDCFQFPDNIDELPDPQTLVLDSGIHPWVQ